MNIKNIALREIKAFAEANEDYTLGEVLYSILRLDESGIVRTVKDIKHLTDEKIYSLVRLAIEAENEVPFTKEELEKIQ